jgi:hypothetical protein
MDVLYIVAVVVLALAVEWLFRPAERATAGGGGCGGGD